MDKAEKQEESSNKLPQEKKAFPSKPQAFLPKDKNIIGYLIHNHPFVVSSEHWSWYRSVVEHVQVCCCATVALFSLFV